MTDQPLQIERQLNLLPDEGRLRRLRMAQIATPPWQPRPHYCAYTGGLICNDHEPTPACEDAP